MNQAKLLTMGKTLVLVGLLAVGLLAIACQSQTPSAPVSSGNVSQSTVESLTSDMPRCLDMEQRDAFSFDWPDSENVQEKLAEYHWGYYRCAVTQPELSAFYRENMVKPPYQWREVNHAEHNNGIVVLFYHPVKIAWNYLWMLPGPEAQSSYLVISRSDPGESQAWECRLSLLETLMRANRGG